MGGPPFGPEEVRTRSNRFLRSQTRNGENQTGKGRRGNHPRHSLQRRTVFGVERQRLVERTPGNWTLVHQAGVLYQGNFENETKRRTLGQEPASADSRLQHVHVSK